MNSVKRMLVMVMLLVLLLAGGYQPALGQAGTIKIGAIVPLTGPVGPSGQAMQKGYTLAVEEINRNPPLGRRVELIIEDDRGDPPTAAAAYLKLVTRDRVDAVIGGLQSATSIAVGAQARQHPTLMAWIGAAAVDFERQLADADWFFHYHPWTYNNAESTWAFVRSTGARTVAIAAEDGPFGESSLIDGAPFARAAGLNTVLVERFRSGTPDLTPLLTKARGANADIFVFVCFDQDVIPLVTQARQVGLAPKLILAAPPGWPIGYDKLPAGNNVAGMALWTADNGHPASRRFVQQYRERFKEEPTFYWGPLAYTNLITVADAIRRVGSTELNALVSGMRATDYVGPIGIRLSFKRSSYGKNQGFTRLIAFQWQNGRQVPVWPEEVAAGRLLYPAPYGR